MDKNSLLQMLSQVRKGKITPEEASQRILELPYQDIGHTKLDMMREMRVGYPEVIYCEGKTLNQLQEIFGKLLEGDGNILGTRATEEMYRSIARLSKEIVYYPVSRLLTLKRQPIMYSETSVAIVTAGTSDLPVAEEAEKTLDFYGNKVKMITDVGVAGIHRLFSVLPVIREARVVIVVAGMEGALASVVGGLVEKPVIAVPTSVGYGASFQGLAALLSMLNTCASGVGVVNIDNGFGAGYLASTINKL